MWGEARLELAVTAAGALRGNRVKAQFQDARYELVYNESFGRANGRSYSVPLRPDFVLHQDGKPVIALDAKFRFDLKALHDTEEDDTYEQDVASGDVSRIVKRTDIYKMHTYRDALRSVRAAVVLFPGSEGAGVFYERQTGQKQHLNLQSLIKEHMEGVGAIPFTPGDPKKSLITPEEKE